MKESKALELLMQVEPGMVLVNKIDFSLLIVRNLGDGKYLCISEDNRIVIIDLLEELKSEENIAGIYSIPNSQCDDCGYIEKVPLCKYPKCGSENVTQWTRIIGYLRPIKGFSAGRIIEAGRRVYHSKPQEI